MEGDTEPIFSIRGVSKHFGGTKALENITFDIRAGEIHAIVGENGAGKSTLMNILSGTIAHDAGEIFCNGRPVTNQTPRGMRDLGVAMVHQELNLLPQRDVVQNAFLGMELTKPGGVLDYAAMRERTAAQLERLGVHTLPEGPLRNFPVATLQLVEIAKALLRESRVVIMDEPNSALSEQESRKLFEIIRSLKAQGITIVYISHRLEQVLDLVDRITVLRDGSFIDTVDAKDVSIEDLVGMMLGRRLDNMYPEKRSPARAEARTILELRHVSGRGKVSDVSLKLRAGEVAGVFGLEGSGRQEVAEMIYGVAAPDAGEILVNGAPAGLHSPAAAKAAGIAYVPADRKWEGLVPGQSIRANVSLSILSRVSQCGVVRRGFLDGIVRRFADRLRLKYSGIGQTVSGLSGGNQQKVVLSKALAAEPEIVVLSEPTRGIDIGAKREIYEQINAMAGEGLGVLFISSELPEVMALCDRIYVMCAGSVRAELRPEETNGEALLALACGA